MTKSRIIHIQGAEISIISRQEEDLISLTDMAKSQMQEAIKENLIPEELTKQQISLVYADEADLLNMALFGKTARQWRN